MLKHIILFITLNLILLLGNSCTSKKKTLNETKAIQQLLSQSNYTFEQIAECNCRGEGPSVFDGVGTTRWDFNLENMVQVIDTFLTNQVRLKFHNSDFICVKVLKWHIDMSSNEKKLRSIYNYVPINTYDKFKAGKLIKQFQKAAIKCGAKLKE